jgi:hypothetical protein
MKSRLALAGSIILLVVSLEQAAAGPRTADKGFRPNEFGPSAYRVADPYGRQTAPRGASQRTFSERTCTYQGGPKSNLWTCH